ncbi:MAG: ATP-dependent DNA helicase RecG [Lachnospiraceae bacterium]|nr:ATP-dependent DNA helicase RecG [Lachnospiraceae bacterium]
MKEEASLDILKGIGEKTKLVFQKAGIETVGDLLNYYPRAYDTFEEPVEIENLADGRIQAVCGFIEKTLSIRHAGRFQIASGKIRCGSDTVAVVWFNMPYLRNTVKPALRYVFRGRVKKKGQQLTLEQPAIFDVFQYEEKVRQLQPVYPLVSGLTAHMLEKALRQAIDGMDLTRDYLPSDLRKEQELAEYNFAVQQIHFPKDIQAMHLARRRLVFDEFFLFILALQRLKSARETVFHSYEIEKTPDTDSILRQLPYKLTGAQQRVWHQIEGELQQKKVMARLIQGDVGSGKTILAFLALVQAAANQAQGALMVPTEVLARQHFEAFQDLMERCHLPYQAVLLTGSLPAKEKRKICEQIESGQASVIIGTHALIQEKVTYHQLVLVITDEQHRFGVKQREALAYKGELPHTVVMSATPIPRTLAVILYGDLDVSVIDELPASRLPIKNCVVGTSYRKKAYAFIQKEIQQGHQAYIICPMVEESEVIEAENVIDYTDRLRAHYPESIRVEYLHGKMKANEKNEIMERFLKNEIQVLISTTVIEVGVNVPNATVMMIENAERFGLAQLHQLRGRVGRGAAQSYCMMVRGNDNQAVAERLEILNKSNDGFEIARKDLKLRGPGDLFGIRQSGLLDFQIADVFADADVMQSASEAAARILKEDPELQSEKHLYLQKKLTSYMKNGLENLNI